MLYLLPTLLFAVSFADIDCGSIVYIKDGIMVGYPIGKCEFEAGKAYMYVCDTDGSKVNRIHYTTSDCSGNPQNTSYDVCQHYPEFCSTTCDTGACDNGVTETIYGSSEDCSGDIETKTVYLIGYCLGSSSQTRKVLCNDGKIQFDTYENGNCSGDPMPSIKYDISTCMSESSGTSYQYEGCDDSYCSTLQVLIAVIIVFIVSLF